MERKPVESSNIKSVGYDEVTKTLEIEFKGSGVYQYKGVPKEIYEGFSKAESIGKYFYAKVKSNREYKFEKVVTLPDQKEIVRNNIKQDLEVIKLPYESEDNQVGNA